MSENLLKAVKNNSLTPEQAVQQANRLPVSPVRTSGAVRTFTPRPKAERIGQYMDEKQIRQEMLKRKTPFISQDISGDFYLSQGLVLVGGVSGRGKSTLNANLVAGFLVAHPEKSVISITNEETTEASLNRISCIQLGLNFFDFQKGRLSPVKAAKVEERAFEIADRVLVVDDPAFDMTVIEDVQSVLIHAARDERVGIIFLDYLQTVAVSRENPELTPIQVSKNLGLWLKDYSRRVGKPVVVFAQLKTNTESYEFKDRVENDRTMYNHAFQCIEVLPDFENKMTRFKVFKDRFGYKQGLVLEARFENGMYSPVL